MDSDYMQEHPVNEADIVSAEQVDVEEVEMDEIWSFVHDKSQQYWLWWAIDHQSGVPLAYCFGTREHRNLDNCGLYRRRFTSILSMRTVITLMSRITESTIVTGKKNTQRIERKHLSRST